MAGDPIAPATRVPFKTQTLVQAINAGGPSYTGVDGISYVADQDYSGGTTANFVNAIANTEDDTIYQTERYGNFNYAIPLANGSYWLNLKFAEIYWTSNGSRVFSVTAEGNSIISNLDIHSLVGANYAYDLNFPVEVSDGVLDLVFTTSVDNSKLSALVITTSPVPFSDFASWQTFYFGSPSAPEADPFIDYEGDGGLTGLEYYFGGDPTFSDFVYISPAFELTQGNQPKFSISYRKAVPTANYMVKWSLGLAPANWFGYDMEEEIYDSVTDTYRFSVPIIPEEPNKFLRLEVGP